MLDEVAYFISLNPLVIFKILYSTKFWQGEILIDTGSSNIWRKIFWQIVTVFHYTPVNAKWLDGLNIDGLAGKRQKCQNFPRQNFALYGSLQTIAT